MDRLTKESLNQITSRRENVRKLMIALNDEYEMIEACHRNLLKKYYDIDSLNLNNTNKGGNNYEK